jgi:hypothetical protein
VPESLEKAVSVSCGGYHTVATTHDSRVVCWGKNNNGQCSVPVGLENVIAVSGGAQHTPIPSPTHHFPLPVDGCRMPSTACNHLCLYLLHLLLV